MTRAYATIANAGKRVDGAIMGDLPRVVDSVVTRRNGKVRRNSPVPHAVLQPAEAETLFYETLQRLSGSGRRPVAVIAGNHDHPDRLSAAGPLALAHGVPVVLVGRTEEKADIGRRVEWAGAGMHLPSAGPPDDPRRLRRAVEHAASDPGMRAAAARIAASSSAGVLHVATRSPTASSNPSTGSDTSGVPHASTSNTRLDTKPHPRMVSQWSLSTTPALE